MKKLFFFLAAMVVAMTANAKVTTISPDAENDALRLAVHYAEDGDIIEMTEGTYVQCNNGYVAFDGKAVTVRAAEGANVVLQPQVRITLANGGKATFENIKIDASRIHELADWYEHVFYVADATEGKQLVLNSCEFYGFDVNKSAIYAGSDKKLDLCSLTNCYFHNNDKSCLFFEGESLGELSITNSTFANITAKVTDSYYAGVVDVRNSAAKVTIDHCTFYNCLLMNTDYAAITMKGPQAANVTISNNIFMLPEAMDGQRAIRNDVEAKNCMTFNYLKDNGGIHSSVTKTNCQLNVDPKFVGADKGNFALAEGSPALAAGTDGSNLGDPRWNAPAVEEPEVELPEPTYTENKLNPYAFGLESVLSDDKATLTVTYRLNNSNATSVNVVVYNGEEKVATIPGTTAIGVNTVEVATDDLPGGVELTWGIEVNGTSVEAPTLEEKIYSFYHPSGVDIDNNPENATFGMLLVNEAMQSVASKTEGYVSAGFGAGIFAFTPSFDLIPNGELPGYNGGKTFSTVKNDFAPRRIRISEDGRIFATAQDGSGEYLWEINPENLNDWTTVFQGTNDGYTLKDAEGNFIAGTNSGFDVRGEGENLQLLMLSASLPGAQVGSFKCHTYDLGAATTWATAPTKEIPGANYMLVTNQSNAQFDKDGGVWYIQYRGTTTESEPGLVHINKDGVEDLKQLRHYTRNAGFRFTDDFSKVIIAGVTDGSNVKKATIYAVSQDENGAPVLTEETVIETSVLGSNLNDFAWDYAGNLYGVSNSNEKLAAWAMPYSGKVETPAAAKYAFQLPEPLKMAGVVKRAVQNGDAVIVLTHEEDGTAHIYQVINGKARVEISQEGVIARDPENAGDLLAISDIALTEDGKLVATNYMITQSADDQVVAGDKRGETRVYIWNDLAGAPSVLFTSKMSSNWFQSKQGLTMAVKGTSADMEIFMTGIHKSKAWARVSSYRVIDGVYAEPEVNHNDHYYFYDINDAVALETTVGTQYELNASPLGEMNWILDANLINPVEIVEPETNNVEIASCVALTEDLGKKFNGASYVTVGEQVLMVAPFATPEGKLIGVEILDITNGLAGALYVDMLYLDEAVEAAAAATAVKVVEGEDANSLVITLVADATLYTLEAELAGEPEYQVYEDEITNLVIDLDNLLLIGGPSSAFQVEVVLGLGEYNMSEDKFQLLPTSSVTLLGTDATFVEGYASVDGIAQTATAVVRVQWNGMFIELHLTMSAAAMDATVVVVENATVEVEKYVIFGDMYDYALKMTGVWTDTTDNTTYPVLVEVPVYYPEATEPSTILSTVTIGDLVDENGPWLGFGEGDLTITTVDGLVTATGIVQNPMAGVAFDITISGKLPETAVDNIPVTVKATKVVKNGQLVIIKGDVEYNAQGAVIK